MRVTSISVGRYCGWMAFDLSLLMLELWGGGLKFGRAETSAEVSATLPHRHSGMGGVGIREGGV